MINALFTLSAAVNAWGMAATSPTGYGIAAIPPGYATVDVIKARTFGERALACDKAALHCRAKAATLNR